MAKRGPSHNFVKQEKERKRLKKAAAKNERRLLKKQQASPDDDPQSNDATDETVNATNDLETTDVEAGAPGETVSKANDTP